MTWSLSVYGEFSYWFVFCCLKFSLKRKLKASKSWVEPCGTLF